MLGGMVLSVSFARLVYKKPMVKFSYAATAEPSIVATPKANELIRGEQRFVASIPGMSLLDYDMYYSLLPDGEWIKMIDTVDGTTKEYLFQAPATQLPNTEYRLAYRALDKAGNLLASVQYPIQLDGEVANSSQQPKPTTQVAGVSIVDPSVQE